MSANIKDSLWQNATGEHIMEARQSKETISNAYVMKDDYPLEALPQTFDAIKGTYHNTY